MPAPYWGFISPERQQLENALLRAQTASMGPKGSTVPLEIARMQIEAAEKAREAEAERPQYFTSGGSLLSVSPQGDVTEAWQAPTPPVTIGVGQALVSPEGEPLYAPPRLTATSTELIATDLSTGELVNRIPITQLPRDAAFFVDKYGKITALDPQSAEVINEYGAEGASVLMQREAKEFEQTSRLREVASEQVWKQMEITKEIADQANITEQQRMVINEGLTREGYDVQREGIVVSERVADKANLSTEQTAKLNAATTRRGQDIQLELGMSDLELRDTLGTGQLGLAVRAEDRAWEAMYIDKTLAEAVGVREESRMVLNAAISREGFGVTREGLEINRDIAREANITEQQRVALNASVTKRGQDLQYELGVSQLELNEILGMGELEVRERAEARAWEQMYISKNVAEQANLTEQSRIKINTILTREGYDVQRDGQAIQMRIAEMMDLTDREKMALTVGLEERRLRIESARVDAEIERGKFMQMGDVMVRRNEDESLEIVFEMPAEQYPLTPIKVGDDKSGYRVGLIDPYKGTVEWFDALPGGAAGAEDAKQHLALLKQATTQADPGNTFLTTVDPEVKAMIYRHTMAFYSSYIQAPRPLGFGYTPEQAAKFAMPMELWRATTDTTLSFGGETAEPTAEMFEKFLQGQPYGQAAAPTVTPPGGEQVVTPTAVAPVEETAATRSSDANKWADRFKDIGSAESIKVIQQYMIDNDLWSGEADGVWSTELDRKFRTAYRRGKIKINEPGGGEAPAATTTQPTAPAEPKKPMSPEVKTAILEGTKAILAAGWSIAGIFNFWDSNSTAVFHNFMRTLVPGYTLGK